MARYNCKTYIALLTTSLGLSDSARHQQCMHCSPVMKLRVVDDDAMIFV